MVAGDVGVCCAGWRSAHHISQLGAIRSALDFVRDRGVPGAITVEGASARGVKTRARGGWLRALLFLSADLLVVPKNYTSLDETVRAVLLADFTAPVAASTASSN